MLPGSSLDNPSRPVTLLRYFWCVPGGWMWARGPIPLPRTIGVVCETWEQAENNLRTAIYAFHPDATEEVLTDRFQEILAEHLSERSERRVVEEAFRSDIEAALRLGHSLREVARGFIAELVVHDRRTEGHTGGDLGLVLSRPRVQRVPE